MPHCVIEYSAPLAEQIDISKLVKATHQGAVDSGLFETSAIKTRAHRCDDFLIGDDPKNSFIHIRLSIMPGRSHEQKTVLLEQVYSKVSTLTAGVNSVTMEVLDIDRQNYFKALALT
ncbi:5-carboxymethyl-2-hydroxymuconate Delta-isomerase [Shewanella psychropiezotolerans]|uniref:5-carboxymethyl-2-hydroxymuconate Delta-isomerase n=1 Tax=Shewanella psychropiezotolerans TaxID=2593655 RepID=A0ABX5WYD0_9GAMM|nr:MULTISPECIES: 5-carboxymethyl-2-hydroxymuconate Delta-isomerase [Shewanella]MPY26559.1 5-carboxymethyl-2-hydroxymuconate Delta-isomerase [Shewanella sp. YLB-07]QDO83778.1 5-carboxymethyl-2-hydroxymuconate Delta-isomerase [Shewanella psychropiezotolerans]